MSILLDTHYVIWLAIHPALLTDPERRLLERHPEQISVSVVSFWEVCVKWEALHRRGKSAGVCGVDDALSFVTSAGFPIEDLTVGAVAERLTTDVDHPDPFDRMLLVHAQHLGARLLTRDGKLAAHPLVLMA